MNHFTGLYKLYFQRVLALICHTKKTMKFKYIVPRKTKGRPGCLKVAFLSGIKGICKPEYMRIRSAM